MSALSWTDRLTIRAPRDADIQETPEGFVVTWRGNRSWESVAMVLGTGLFILALNGSPRTYGPDVWFSEVTWVTLIAIVVSAVGGGMLIFQLVLGGKSSLSVTRTHLRAKGTGAAYPGSLLLAALDGVVCGEQIAGTRRRGFVGAALFVSGRWHPEDDLIMVPTLYAINHDKEGVPLFHSVPSKNLGAWVEHVLHTWLSARGSGRARAP